MISLHKSLYIVFLSWIFCIEATTYSKVVIWGHKLHSHTHSYIHAAFEKAFKALGYPVHWLDNNSDCAGIDFENALFITEGQVDQNIPLVPSSFYVIHNCDGRKYFSHIDQSHILTLQVYSDDVIPRPGHERWEEAIYFSEKEQVLYMPWATDLLPSEIDENIKKIDTFTNKKVINWIGTVAEGVFGNVTEIDGFHRAAQENGIKFVISNPWTKGISFKENQRLIQESFMAPTIVGQWQAKAGYIPCRIFKNISYGQFPITNSYRSYMVLEEKPIITQIHISCFFDGLKCRRKKYRESLIEIMNLVKTKHTYLNRIQTINRALDKISLAKTQD